MIHEPRGFLGNAECPMHFVAADPIFAVGNHPYRSEPFPQIDRAVLEDGPDLGRKLATRMLFPALPNSPSRNEARISASTGRAMHTIRPAQFDHRAKRDVGVREVTDCLDEGLWFGSYVRHADQYDSGRSLCQVCYCPSKVKS